MVDRNCGNCRYYLAEEADSGDCLSMMSGRVKTQAKDHCLAHAHGMNVTQIAAAMEPPVLEET